MDHQFGFEHNTSNTDHVLCIIGIFCRERWGINWGNLIAICGLSRKPKIQVGEVLYDILIGFDQRCSYIC